MLRLGCIAPGTLGHKAMEVVEIGGYKFKPETIFIGNFMSTHMDEEYWKEPEKFMPERFLDAVNGRILPDSSNFMPFSFGKRVCLGESLAKVELFLFFTALFKNFRFTLPKHNPVPSAEDYSILITKVPNAYYCSVMERY